MTIQYLSDDIWRNATKPEFQLLVQHGIIQPNTKIILGDKQFRASQIKGIVFPTENVTVLEANERKTAPAITAIPLKPEIAPKSSLVDSYNKYFDVCIDRTVGALQKREVRNFLRVFSVIWLASMSAAFLLCLCVAAVGISCSASTEDTEQTSPSAVKREESRRSGGSTSAYFTNTPGYTNVVGKDYPDTSSERSILIPSPVSTPGVVQPDQATANMRRLYASFYE